MGDLGYYLIAVNAVGIMLVVMKTWLRTDMLCRGMELIVTVISLAGGAPCVAAAMLLVDRKANKKNMMLRVLIICAAVIEVIILLMVKGMHHGELTFAFWEYFGDHKVLSAYLVAINIITLTAFGIDKRNAAGHRFRIRIATLLGLAFAGGAVGGLVGMYVFRHKTRKNYFVYGIPLIILTQAVVVFYLMNVK